MIKVIKVLEGIEKNIFNENEREYHIPVEINDKRNDEEGCYICVCYQDNEKPTFLLFSDMENDCLDYAFTEEDIVKYTNIVTDYEKEVKTVNISKKNLEILMEGYTINNFIDCNPKMTKQGKHEFGVGELLIDLDEEKKKINIHYIYISSYRNMDYKGQHKDYTKHFDLVLTSNTKNDRDYLKKLEEYCHINKNCLYILIDILKEL